MVFLVILGAMGLAVPVAIMMHQLVATSEPAIIFTLSVMAIALTYGTWPAIIAALISMAFYNFSFIDPVLTFTWPSKAEIVYTIINVIMAAVIPFLFGSKFRPAPMRFAPAKRRVD